MEWHSPKSSEQLARLLSDSFEISQQKLGVWLISEQVISSAQLEQLLGLQQQNKMRLGRLLLEQGMASEGQLAQVLALKFGIPLVHISHFPISETAITRVPAELAQRHQMMPLAVIENQLIVALEQPLDNEGLEWLRFAVNCPVVAVLAPATEIILALARYYSEYDEAEALLEADQQRRGERSAHLLVRQLEKQANRRPVVRLLNTLILHGMARRASDINIRPGRDDVKVYYRIDGRLQWARSFDKTLLAPLVSRAKIIAQMDISERRLPQDGHAQMRKRGQFIDLRLSTIPTVNGESVVIRLLDPSHSLREIKQLGVTDQVCVQLQKMTLQPSGLILVVGPTGAGKTTTLYALLNAINRQQRHILTVEDPVEFNFDGIEQVQVNQRKGVTFPSVLRHFLRHDPDVIMVGEIRDHETAVLANRAALTGHLVLTTLHTQNAVGSVLRLMNMGIEHYLLADTLAGVVAQRLVRRNCPHCLVFDNISMAARKQLGLAEDVSVWRGQGCALCHHSGYHGRLLVTEILTMNQNLAASIAGQAASADIERLARMNGLRSFSEQAVILLNKRLTSIEEARTLCLDS